MKRNHPGHAKSCNSHMEKSWKLTFWKHKSCTLATLSVPDTKPHPLRWRTTYGKLQLKEIKKIIAIMKDTRLTCSPAVSNIANSLWAEESATPSPLLTPASLFATLTNPSPAARNAGGNSQNARLAISESLSQDMSTDIWFQKTLRTCQFFANVISRSLSRPNRVIFAPAPSGSGHAKVEKRRISCNFYQPKTHVSYLVISLAAHHCQQLWM